MHVKELNVVSIRSEALKYYKSSFNYKNQNKKKMLNCNNLFVAITWAKTLSIFLFGMKQK